MRAAQIKLDDEGVGIDRRSMRKRFDAEVVLASARIQSPLFHQNLDVVRRTREDVKINCYSMGLYVSQGEGVAPVSRMWYDDVVLATEYIGPRTPDAGAPAGGEQKP